MNPERYRELMLSDENTYAIDLDGTLAQGVWPDRHIGQPIQKNIYKLNMIPVENRAIYTARPWSDYEAIKEWVEHHQLQIGRIVCGKFLAKVYIDDRAFNAERDIWTP